MVETTVLVVDLPVALSLVAKMSSNSTLDLMVAGLRFLHKDICGLVKVAQIFWNGSYDQ